MSVLRKAVNIAVHQGLLSAFTAGIGFVYNRTIWPLLPETETWVTYNSVKAHRRRLGDAYVPFPTQGSEIDVEYEVVLGRAIRDFVEDGDTVVEVAWGLGITATIAAMQVGETGEVVTYEGSQKLARECSRTARQNGVADRVMVYNSVVGETTETVRFTSSTLDSPRIGIADLPAADVFVLDCDGGEREFLKSLRVIDSDLVIVEHHAVLNIDPPVEYDPGQVRTLLQEQGYSIEREYTQRMDASIPEFGSEETVFVARQ